MDITYNPTALPDELRDALAALGDEYPIIAADGDALVSFRPIAADTRTSRVVREADRFVIEHTDLAAALRGAGTLLAGAALDQPDEQTLRFETFGIMLDVSRNAVMRIPHVKGWLRRLALMGFDTVMLYTEDVYQLDREPFFGYQRGAYSADELREIDAYADRLGIEMIPCVQTLGHMAQILKWPAYEPVRDTDTVLLAEEEPTFELIGKILDFWQAALRTRRIHVGMDETHDLGRGVYMDRHGYRDGFELFNRHLSHVVAMCHERGLEPMIWSDMYFRLGSATGDYYDRASSVPDEARQAIPKDVQLVYWDYYHTDEGFYEEWIRRHRDLGFDPVVCSGVWTWAAPWHGTNYTEARAGACVRACWRAGVKALFFTMWGDDGSMCDFDSAMTGLTYVSELAWGGDVNEAQAAARYEALTGGDYQASRAAGMLSFFEPQGVPDGDVTSGLWGWPTLWDDPLLGIYWHDKRAQRGQAWDEVLAHYRQISQTLAPWLDRDDVDTRGGDLRHAALIAGVLLEKVALRSRLETAYRDRDTDGLRQACSGAHGLIDRLHALDASYRRQWLGRNKPFGLEVVQVRLAGLIRRYRELIDRVEELIDGKIDRIAELEGVPQVASGVRPSYGRVSTACDNFA